MSRIGAKAVSGRPFDIGQLAEGEAVRAVRRMLRRRPIVATDRERKDWATWLVIWSGRWPQHLQNGMLAPGEEPRDNDRQLDRVEAQAMERRRLSYEERIDSDEMRSACRLVAKVMAELPETGAREATIQAMILRHKAPSGDPDGEGLWMPERDDGDPMTAMRFSTIW